MDSRRAPAAREPGAVRREVEAPAERATARRGDPRADSERCDRRPRLTEPLRGHAGLDGENPDAAAEHPEGIGERAEPVAGRAEPLDERTEPVTERNEPVDEHAEPVDERTEPDSRRYAPVHERYDPHFERYDEGRDTYGARSERSDSTLERPEPLATSREAGFVFAQPVLAFGEVGFVFREPGRSVCAPLPSIHTLALCVAMVLLASQTALLALGEPVPSVNRQLARSRSPLGGTAKRFAPRRASLFGRALRPPSARTIGTRSRDPGRG